MLPGCSMINTITSPLINDVAQHQQLDPLPSDTLTTHTLSATDTETASSPSPHFKSHLFACLCLGQLCSVLITGTGVFSQLLVERHVSIPTTQSAATYILLSLFTVHIVNKYRQRRKEYAAAASPLSSPPPSLLCVPWYVYFLLAVCDVEGNCLLVLAYRYTTITSVQLLDCATIPLVMGLSRIVFRVRYNRHHLLGAVVCLLGMGLLITSDILQHRYENSSDNSNPLLGDMLVLLGCCCYAVSNVGQERLVKAYDRVEFLGMIGLFGAVISIVQITIAERSDVQQIDWADNITLAYLVGSSMCLYFLYLCVPVVLSHTSAVFLNLSLLTSDFWSILFAYLLFAARLHALYFVAFMLIIIGLILFNLAVAGVSISTAIQQTVKRCTTMQTARAAHSTLLQQEIH